MSLFKKSCSAVEIGTRTLKGITLKKVKSEVCVDSYFFHDFSVDNELYPLEITLEETLKALVEVHSLDGKKVVTCLDDKDIMIHTCKFPPMPKSDLDIAIRNEIEEHLSIPAFEAIYDPVLIETYREDDTLFKNYNVYCTRRNIVEKLQKTFEVHNLEITAVESGALARVAMLDFNGYAKPNKVYICMDFGENHITLTLLKNHKIVINNVLTMGMGLINKVLFESQGLPYQMSEEIKVNYDSQMNEADLDDNHKAMDEVYYQIFYKVQRLVDFFKAQTKDQAIESILITGGGSQVHHLDKLLESYCGLPAIIVNPFLNIRIYTNDNPKDDRISTLAPYMATAVGMALRGI